MEMLTGMLVVAALVCCAKLMVLAPTGFEILPPSSRPSPFAIHTMKLVQALQKTPPAKASPIPPAPVPVVYVRDEAEVARLSEQLDAITAINAQRVNDTAREFEQRLTAKRNAKELDALLMDFHGYEDSPLAPGHDGPTVSSGTISWRSK